MDGHLSFLCGGCQCSLSEPHHGVCVGLCVCGGWVCEQGCVCAGGCARWGCVFVWLGVCVWRLIGDIIAQCFMYWVYKQKKQNNNNRKRYCYVVGYRSNSIFSIFFYQQDIMSEFGISVKAAMYAVIMNSGDIDATYHYIRTGQPPQGMYHLHTQSDSYDWSSRSHIYCSYL